ncbi:hypothetical protein PFICI_14473 [Pestalotiopsis fici W106-1]|uniref:Aminoglycoside phosphotransferase domain-containing protein n=1 Tax=Pestalotiopsis fici (strain W106-1 / CGMCC3.15140) TaxID=1229662 RepID=W3WK41_PESFW|nr:uncharacterized protein PFICI_14473 [Pestalotiopsis fici W106-1]ETS73527.1 hypothetical protein PFICI_14473 [Pestalotiopsis fici W106-1]
MSNMKGDLVVSFLSPSSPPISSIASSPLESVCSTKDDLPEQNLAAKVYLQCQRLWESSEIKIGDEIQTARHRSFPITVSDENGSDEFIFQVPNDTSDIELTAAVYNYIHQELDLKANTPRVHHKNSGFDGPVGHPYLVFSRLPGLSLQETWPNLTHEQRLSVARQVGELYLDLQSATNSHCGLFKVPMDRYGHSMEGSVLLEAFGQQRYHLENTERDSIELEEDGLVNLNNLRKDPPGLSARDMAILTFERRKYYSSASRRQWLEEYTDKAVDMIKAITHKGLLDDTICIWHRNISAENILIERDANGEPKITGLLGWDGAGFAPRFMTCRAPQWLWTRVGTKVVRFAPGPCDGNIHVSKGYPEMDEEPFEAFEPTKSEAKKIKAAFDEAVGEVFTRAAYDTHMIIARRLMHVAACSVWDLDHTQELAMIFAEWEHRKIRAEKLKEGVRNMLDRGEVRRRGSL